MTGVVETAARFLELAAALVLFGSSLFDLALTGFAPPLARAWSRRLLTAATLIALAATVLWLMAVSSILEDRAAAALDPSALWSLIKDTSFGRGAGARLLFLAISIIVTRQPITHSHIGLLTLLALGAVATFAWTGHGGEGSGSGREIHRAADVIHLASAGIWIGALVRLTPIMRRSLDTQSPDDLMYSYIALARFSVIGPLVVAALILTGLLNTSFIVGFTRWNVFIETSYGWTLLAKLAIFVIMLGLAGTNRWILMPTLARARETTTSTELSAALRSLHRSVLIETALGFAVLGVVALLGDLTPGFGR